MSSSVHKPKLLLDENVRIELFRFLKENFFDVKKVKKGISDSSVIKISNSEKRVLITNDSDFLEPTCAKEKVFSIIVLKIPQNKPNTLINLFFSCINKITLKELKGKVFELKESGLVLQKPSKK